jgi:LysM repeat protein
MRIILILVSLLFTGISAYSQDMLARVIKDTAYIQVSIKGFHSWASLSQLWKLPESEIRSANPQIEPGMYAGFRDISVPISDIISTVNCKDCKPVYHRVNTSEGLYRIGVWYGKTSVGKLKELNNLRSDALKPGQQLLVGYVNLPLPDLVGKEFESLVATPDTTGIFGVNRNLSAVELVSLKKDTVVNPINIVEPEHVLVYSGLGLFEPEYEIPKNSGVKKTGKAAIFKSESGWTDGRFYLLNNQLKTGSVVKVLNPENGVFLFAKVVGPLPDIKQNIGLQYRISNAAAAMLGFADKALIFEINLEY